MIYNENSHGDSHGIAAKDDIISAIRLAMLLRLADPDGLHTRHTLLDALDVERRHGAREVGGSGGLEPERDHVHELGGAGAGAGRGGRAGSGDHEREGEEDVPGSAHALGW